MARSRSNRLSFAKLPEVQPIPDLLAVQRESFDAFLTARLGSLPRTSFERLVNTEDWIEVREMATDVLALLRSTGSAA